LASKPVQNITRESGFFYALHPPGGDISSLTSQAAIATRCQQRCAAFSLLRRSEPPLKQIVRTAERWRVTAWPKKTFADQNRTTPHPPAVFGS